MRPPSIPLNGERVDMGSMGNRAGAPSAEMSTREKRDHVGEHQVPGLETRLGRGGQSKARQGRGLQ